MYTHTHSTHSGLDCSICQNATKHLMYNKKCNIQISPSFLTLPAFYRLVCYTVLKKPCARQYSSIKQRRMFALASFSILLLWYSARLSTDLTQAGRGTLFEQLPPLLREGLPQHKVSSLQNAA